MTTRRELLLGAMSLATGKSAATPQRPNVLFIMADEMRAGALGCAGHPVVKTPNLDRIANQGVRFASTYTVGPVCGPSRTSAFCGRYVHVHGTTSNDVPPHPNEIFLPSILKHYGYDTAIAGKLHFAPAKFGYDFDKFWSYTNEGPTPEIGYLAYLHKKYKSKDRWPKAPGTSPWPKDPLGHDVGVYSRPDEDFETEWLTERCLEYVRERKDNPRPWFLFASYTKPHSPSVELKRYFDMYDPATVPVPKLPADAKQIRWEDHGKGKWSRLHLDDERIERVMSAIYFGAITHLDDQLGRIFGELDKLEMADHTLIVFTSDHGNMLGDRGRWFKGVMYEGASHIPLLMRAPKSSPEKRGHVEDRLVENVDLTPTVLDYAGIPIPCGMQGRSLMQLEQGKACAWRDRVYSQLGTGMVRTADWKLIDNSHTLRGPLELYDMRHDPLEERNLINDPAREPLVEELKQSLTRWREEKPEPVRIAGMQLPEYCRARQNEPPRK